MLTYEDIKNRSSIADYVMGKMRLDMTSYDAKGKSRNQETKVPNVVFELPNVLVQLDEVDDRNGHFEREVQIVYACTTFVFFISKCEKCGKFVAIAYTPAGDGKGGLFDLKEKRVFE